VQARDAGRLPVYRQYDGPDLHEHSLPPEIAAKQIGLLTTLGTSVVAIAASLIVPQ